MATFASDLPDEVMVEVLSWLPPESIIRSKCVCKSWSSLINNLIKDQKFIAKHLQNSMSSTTCLLFSDYHSCHCELRTPKCSQVFFSLLTMCKDDNGDGLIRCVTKDFNASLARRYANNGVLRLHCNGILFLVDSSHQRDTFALFNPAINELRLLPKPSITGLFFTQGFGFGYDLRANDYKIIRFGIDCENFIDRAEVYQMGTDSWREIYTNMEGIIGERTKFSVYCKGIFYWYNWGCDHVLSFDTSEEKFDNIVLPNYLSTYDAVCQNFAVWNESVALFVGLDQVSIDIWVLDNCYDGVKVSCPWNKLLRVGPLINIKTPLTFWKNDELLLVLNDETLAAYNLSSQELRVVENFHGMGEIRCWSCSYVKSLVSVQCRG